MKRISPLHSEEIPVQLEQNDTMRYEIQHVPLKFDQEEVRKLHEKGPHYVKLIENMKLKNKGGQEHYNLDLFGTLHKKIRDHGKEIRVLIVPNAIQKYMLYESQNSLGHNGTTRFYQFLKRQCNQKCLKESVQKFVRDCLKCQKNLQTLNYVLLHLDIPQTPMDFISMELIGPFETTFK